MLMAAGHGRSVASRTQLSLCVVKYNLESKLIRSQLHLFCMASKYLRSPDAKWK